MQHFKSLKTALAAALFFCLSFPQIAHAATGEGRSFTTPELLVFTLVLVWYLFNHFRPKVMELLKKNRQKEK